MLLPKEYPSMGLKKKQKCSPSQAMNVGMEDTQKTPETDEDEKRGKSTSVLDLHLFLHCALFLHGVGSFLQLVF